MTAQGWAYRHRGCPGTMENMLKDLEEIQGHLVEIRKLAESSPPEAAAALNSFADAMEAWAREYDRKADIVLHVTRRKGRGMC